MPGPSYILRDSLKRAKHDAVATEPAAPYATALVASDDLVEDGALVAFTDGGRVATDTGLAVALGVGLGVARGVGVTVA